MKISVHVNLKNPKLNQFPYREAITSYCQLAEEVIVVDGGTTDGSIEEIKAISPAVKVIEYPWADDWVWHQLALSTQKGYEACTGDWAIKMDLDYLVHENDIKEIRDRLHFMLYHFVPPMAATFQKVQFQLIDRYYAKSKTHLAINKKHWGDKLAYGIAGKGDEDFMWAIVKQGELKDREGRTVNYGRSIEEYEQFIQRLGKAILCYDLTFNTLEHLLASRPQYYRAKERYYSAGIDEERLESKTNKHASINELRHQFDGRRINKHWIPFAFDGHPQVIKNRIKHMTPAMFGYNNFGWFGNDYKAVYFP